MFCHTVQYYIKVKMNGLLKCYINKYQKHIIECKQQDIEYSSIIPLIEISKAYKLNNKGP